MPRPVAGSVWRRSAMSSAGSPKKMSPPWVARVTKPRWMAPTEAAEMLPYCFWKVAEFSPTYPSVAWRSLRSRRSRPLSSAILKTRLRTPDWMSLRLRMRESRSGPISEMVARMGWPCWPKTSQRVTGVGSSWKPERLRRWRRALNLGLGVPGSEMPERSPLTSAAKTGTPMREKASAMTWRVTVLPVPVAPATRPWRLAMPGRSSTNSGGAASVWAIRSGSGMRRVSGWSNSPAPNTTVPPGPFWNVNPTFGGCLRWGL